MATKRRRGAGWHYTIRRKDLLPQPIYLSFEDEHEGDEYVRRLEALLDRGQVPDQFMQRKAGKGLRDHLRRYLATQPVSDDDTKLLAIVTARLPKDLTLAQLTFAWATQWVTDLKREQNLSPSTIRHHVGALSRALDWLAGHGHLPMNPLRLLKRGYAAYTPEDARAADVVKVDVERERRLEPGEEAAIRRILSGGKPKGRQRPLDLPEAPALLLLFDMALESAMRLREMFTLGRGQVDRRRHTIFLDKTKNGDKRQVPITTVLNALLRDYAGDYDGAVFPWWDGERASLARTTSRLSRQWARIFSAAGCDDLHFHDLRHEATSRIYERTKLSDLEVARITGHKDLRTLKRYANLRASDLAKRLW